MVFTSCRLGCFRGFAALTLLTAASIARAQGVSSPPESDDPLDALARVPAVTYQSPLAGYRRLGDEKSIPWKEANETVNRIGGWRAYTREAQRPDAADSEPDTPGAPAPAPASTPAGADRKMR